jgi:hypothetical protein
VCDFLLRVNRIEVDIVVIDGEARDGDEEGERPGPLVAEQVDVERLGTFVGVREYETGAGVARRDPHVHAVAEELLLGLLAFLVAASQRGDLHRRVGEAEELARLLLVRDRRSNPDAILDLRDSTFPERHGLHGLEIESRRAARERGEEQRRNEIHRLPNMQCHSHFCIHRGGGSQALMSMSNIDTGSTDNHNTMR